MRRALGPALLIVAFSGLACAALSSWFGAGDRIRFPHARHQQAKIECIACHETIFDQKALGEADALPKEARCLECHRDKKEKGNCEFCHSDPSHPRPSRRRSRTFASRTPATSKR